MNDSIKSLNTAARIVAMWALISSDHRNGLITAEEAVRQMNCKISPVASVVSLGIELGIIEL